MTRAEDIFDSTRDVFCAICTRHIVVAHHHQSVGCWFSLNTSPSRKEKIAACTTCYAAAHEVVRNNGGVGMPGQVDEVLRVMVTHSTKNK